MISYRKLIAVWSEGSKPMKLGWRYGFRDDGSLSGRICRRREIGVWVLIKIIIRTLSLEV